jgi:hypothetical protein
MLAKLNDLLAAVAAATDAVAWRPDGTLIDF